MAREDKTRAVDRAYAETRLSAARAFLQAARELLRLIPGVSGIAFQDENADAQPFWERVATDAVGDRWHLEKGAGPEGLPPDIWLRLDTPSAP